MGARALAGSLGLAKALYLRLGVDATSVQAVPSASKWLAGHRKNGGGNAALGRAQTTVVFLNVRTCDALRVFLPDYFVDLVYGVLQRPVDNISKEA